MGMDAFNNIESSVTVLNASVSWMLDLDKYSVWTRRTFDVSMIWIRIYFKYLFSGILILRSSLKQQMEW